jgi:CDP-glycerol glycerophosphotransferase
MKLVQKAKQLAGHIIRWGYHAMYRFVPVDEKLMLFTSFHGKGYSDNPRAIYEQLRQDPRFQDCMFVWAVKHHNEKHLDIPGAKVIEYFSFSWFYYLAKAKFWIFNCKMPMYIRKKEGQVYLQTWHGTPLKRLGHDICVEEDATFYRSGISFEQMCESYDTDAKRYDYMISPNAFCTDIFPHAFGVDKDKLVETGYPRNDFLSNYTPEDVEQTKEKYGIPKDKKVLLYAPTWRDNSFQTAGYTFELQADFRHWKEVLGKDWVVLFKPHYLIINKFEEDESLKDFLISIPASDEISPLYIVSDALVTDYSSVFFDYAILKRPVYFYMYDLDTYMKDLRGFYLRIPEDLPGPICRDEGELLKEIGKDFDFSKYISFNTRYNNREDGKASVRIADLLVEER